MGDEADDIMVSFRLTADDARQYALVKDRFESHFIIKRNITFERAKFNLTEVNKKVSQSKPSLLIYIVLRNTVNLAY